MGLAQGRLGSSTVAPSELIRPSSLSFGVGDQAAQSTPLLRWGTLGRDVLRGAQEQRAETLTTFSIKQSVDKPILHSRRQLTQHIKLMNRNSTNTSSIETVRC